MTSREAYLNSIRRWQFRSSDLIQPDLFGELLATPPASSESSQTVAVIGAGVAGLSAALALERLGHQPIILEADSRVGGRIRTLREPFDHPLTVDVGAARFRDDHFWAVTACQTLDLPVVPFYPRRVTLVHSNGDGILRNTGCYHSHEIHAAVTATGRRNGCSSSAPALQQTNWAAESWLTIQGGMDQLPEALAGRLAAPLHLNTRVVRISQTGERVTLSLRAGIANAEWTVDRVICTVPFSVISEIIFDPLPPPHQLQIIKQLPYLSANRLMVECTNSGISHGAPSFGATTQLGELWQLEARDYPGCLMVSSLCGDRARERSLQLHDCRDQLVRHLAELCSQRQTQVRRTEWFCWDDQPFARGAQSRVWDLVDVDFHQIRTPHGRVHFAGEHTASIRGIGWMDGAIESGVREALLVHQVAAAK